MPEGPEIRLAADRIEQVIAGKRTTRVEFAFPLLACDQWRLSGREVLSVETRCKAMLTHVEGDLTVYSHNRVYGRWYVMPARRLPKSGRSPRFAIHNDEGSSRERA